MRSTIEILFRLVIAVSLVLMLANGSVAAGEQELSVEGSKCSWITFLSHRTGGNVLYKMRPDGRQLTPIFGGEIRDVPVLVEGAILYREPHWTRQSPNRRYYCSWVYETGIPHSKHQGQSQAMLHVGSLDGHWGRVLNPNGAEKFAWSPDSTRIAFAVVSGGWVNGPYLRSTLPPSTEIAVVGIDGSNEQYVLEQPDTWAVCDWSPDGKKVLLRQTRPRDNSKKESNLMEFDLDSAIAARDKSPYGGTVRGNEWAARVAPTYLRQLLSGSSEKDLNTARYSPDGKFLAIIYANLANMYAPNECGPRKVLRYLGKVAVVEIATGDMKTIADYSEGLRGPMCWSPDGREILFSRYLPKGDDREKKKGTHGLGIWAIGRDGSGARFLTTGWSPDWR